MTPPRTPRTRMASSLRVRSSSGRARLPGMEEPERRAGPGREGVVIPVAADHGAPGAGNPAPPRQAGFLAVELPERRSGAGELVALAARAAPHGQQARAAPAHRERSVAARGGDRPGIAPVDPAAPFQQHRAAGIPGEGAEQGPVLEA